MRICNHCDKSKMNPQPWRAIALRLPWLILIPIGLYLPQVFQRHANGIERIYSNGIYPAIKNVIATVTSLFPLSLAELILYGSVLLFPAILICKLLRAAFGRIPWRRVVSYIVALGIAGGVLLNMFYLTWGCNYFRTPLSERMNLSIGARPVEELSTLCDWLSRDAAVLREKLPETQEGIFTYDVPVSDIFSQLPEAYQNLAQKEPVFRGNVTRAKSVLWSEGMSWAGIAGIYVGFTAEANVNIAQPDLFIAEAAAHEMAHQLGIASENEAEFAAILACLHSYNDTIAYSGYMLALTICGNALYASDARAYAAIVAGYSDAMRRDLSDYAAYWKQYDGPAKEISNQWNDTYLKHNAQESGVKSYGESVDLLLSYFENTKFFRDAK